MSIDLCPPLRVDFYRTGRSRPDSADEPYRAQCSAGHSGVSTKTRRDYVNHTADTLQNYDLLMELLFLHIFFESIKKQLVFDQLINSNLSRY